MVNNENLIPIPGRLHSVATEGHVAGADEIYDDTQQKDQETINSELITAVGTGGSVDSRIAAAVKVEKTRAEGAESALDDKITTEKTRAEAAEGALDGRVDTLEEAVGTGGSVDSRISAAVATETTRAQAAEADRYTKSETYTKEEVNGLVDTPHQEYVTVEAYTDLRNPGSKDTIYRVSNYNGSTSQVDASVYSEYAWNGSQYIFLCVKSQIGEVFDISVYNNNAKYADLAAALNGGANIPQSLQKGGMSVKFVQSSDNKYAQFRYMSSSTAVADFTNVTNWQGVDDEPTSGSNNLVKSGGVYRYLAWVEENINFGDNEGCILSKAINSSNGTLESAFGYKISPEIELTAGQTITSKVDVWIPLGYAAISQVTYNEDVATYIPLVLGDAVNNPADYHPYSYTAQEDITIVFTIQSSVVYDLYKKYLQKAIGVNELINEENRAKGVENSIIEDVDDIEKDIYGKDNVNYIAGKALSSDDSIYDDEDWGISGYVPYELGTGITWNYGQKKANHNLLFYNSAKEYITGAYWAATSDSGQTSIAASSIQQYAPNAAFIRASFLLSNTQAGLSSGDNVIWSPQNIHQKGIKEGVTKNTADILSLYNRLETLIQLNSSMDVRRYLMDNAPYYFDIPNNLSSYDEDNYLDQRIKETPVERQFLFFTDTHQQNTSNCKISSVIEYIKNRLAIPLSVFGGDAIEIYTGDNANYEALANVGNLASEYCSAGGSGFLWVEGNHDANSPGHSDSTIANNYLINDFEEYLRTTRNMPASVHFYDEALEYSSLFLTDIDIASFITSFEADGGIFEADGYSGPTFNGQYVQQLFVGWCKKNYYFDDTKNRVRYLVLDTRDGSIFSRMTKYTNSYILADFIESTLKSVPEGYDIVVLGHQWGNDNNNSPLFSSGDSNLCNLVYQMLLAYKSKGSFTFSPYLYQNYYLGAKWWKAKYGNTGSKTYTFSECKANKIVVLGGHYHFDCAWKVYHSSGTTLAADEIDNGTTIASDEILVVWTHRATYGASSYDPVQQAGLQYARSYSMTNGTISEYAFDVATLLSDRIHFTRYGAGVDREYVFQS